MTVNRGGYQNFRKVAGIDRQESGGPRSLALGSSRERRDRRLGPLAIAPQRSAQQVRVDHPGPVGHAGGPLRACPNVPGVGNWIQASVQFRNLVASQGTEPRYLIAYIDALLDHSEMTNAEIYLERLEKISPNLIDTSALRAHVW